MAKSLMEGTSMSRAAKLYIALILATGTTVLLLAAAKWSSPSLSTFAALLCFTLFASTLKIRIPGMTGTISPNFAFLLVGMTFFSFSQVMVTAAAAALVQSFWRPKSRPRLIHILFSVAALVISSAFAFSASHLIVRPVDHDGAMPLVLLAGFLYLFMNATVVSIVVGLTERQPLTEVCRYCFEWVFPFFAFGIVVIALMSGSFSTVTAWRSSLEVAPAMVLAYLYFLGRSRKQTATTIVSREEEELFALSSR
jgi:hypothetical protein